MRCPVCGDPVTAVADLRERAVERALDQDAHIEMVSGPAAELLRTVGGLGAWTRY